MTGEKPKEYVCCSRAVLPVRMKGKFTFEDAHQLCCEWNSYHPASDLAFPELHEEGTYLEEL